LKNNNTKTSHHIEPVSRLPDWWDANDWHNLMSVRIDLHEKYHYLFNNKTPKEIIEYLNQEFWNDMYDITMVCVDPCKKFVRLDLSIPCENEKHPSPAGRKAKQAYEDLFNTKRPKEVVKYLNKVFWGDKFRITLRKRAAHIPILVETPVPVLSYSGAR